MDSVDLEARRDIAKLWTEVRAHSTDYWGPDKANGKRSDVIDLLGRMTTIESEIQHYKDTHLAECIGVKALKDYMDSLKTEEGLVKVAKINTKGLMAVQWVQVAGLVIVALIALLR
jgi:hypothetical protein